MTPALQRMTTAALLPSAYLAETMARTASLWAWQMTALTRSADTSHAAETQQRIGSTVDLATLEAEDAAAAEADLVAAAVEKTTADRTTTNLLDAVETATSEAARTAETAAAELAEATATPRMTGLPTALQGKPFAAE